MPLPVDDLSKDKLDADADAVPGAGNAREQILASVEKLQALLAVNLAIYDEINAWSARQDFTLSNEAMRLIADSVAGTRLGFYPDHASPSTEGGRIGYEGVTHLLIKNLVNNGHIDLTTLGTGEVRANGNKVLTNSDQKKVELGNSGNISNVPTRDFDDVFTSSYDRYLIELIDIRPVNDVVNFVLRLGTGSTYINTTLYCRCGYKAQSNAGSSSVINGQSENGIILAWALSQGSQAAEGLNGTIELVKPESANTWTQGKVNVSYKSNAASELVSLDFHAAYRSEESHTSIQALFDNGNISSGQIIVNGLR